MTRLIDADALKEETKELYNETLDAIVKFGIDKVYELINNAPTVTNRPKGEWIQSGSERFYCSNCDNLRNVHDYYCEHCGSEMFDDNGNIIIRDWTDKEGGAK